MGKYFAAILQGILVYVLAYGAQWLVALMLNSSPSVILFVSIVLTTGMAAGLGWCIRQSGSRTPNGSPNEIKRALPGIETQQS